jgi:tRNA A37 threonylcarbamoyladenosine modification protein TsaB
MILDWWNDLVRWANSDDGWQIITGAILPFIAILAAGLVAGLIARGSTKRLIVQQDRQHKAAAVASLIAAGRKAATWSTLSASEKDHVDHQASEAEVRVRLLPVDGAALAADWAAHHMTTLRRNSANFSFQAEQDLADLQDGLIAWQNKPAKARRLFAQDLAAWKYETPSAEDELAAKQREWAAGQQTEAVPVPADR